MDAMKEFREKMNDPVLYQRALGIDPYSTKVNDTPRPRYRMKNLNRYELEAKWERAKKSLEQRAKDNS